MALASWGYVYFLSGHLGRYLQFICMVKGGCLYVTILLCIVTVRAHGECVVKGHHIDMWLLYTVTGVPLLGDPSHERATLWETCSLKRGTTTVVVCLVKGGRVTECMCVSEWLHLGREGRGS